MSKIPPDMFDMVLAVRDALDREMCHQCANNEELNIDRLAACAVMAMMNCANRGRQSKEMH